MVIFLETLKQLGIAAHILIDATQVIKISILGHIGSGERTIDAHQNTLHMPICHNLIVENDIVPGNQPQRVI